MIALECVCSGAGAGVSGEFLLILLLPNANVKLHKDLTCGGSFLQDFLFQMQIFTSCIWLDFANTVLNTSLRISKISVKVAKKVIFDLPAMF